VPFRAAALSSSPSPPLLAAPRLPEEAAPGWRPIYSRAALADYGPGAAYQIEISGNVNNLTDAGGKANGSGGGVWFWAALTPTNEAGDVVTGSVDYEETDCIHNVPFAPNGASHNAGETTYTDDTTTGVLTISNVGFSSGPGATTINIALSDAYGHYVVGPDSSAPVFGSTGVTDSALVTGLLNGFLTVQVQVAP
jgi:hypothetical protein